MFDYLILLKALFLVMVIGLLICLGSLFLVYQESDISKYSAYECGFNPYGDARMRFDVKYYVVAILFLIFDLELVFLYSLVCAAKYISFFGFISIYIFLMILLWGLAYELIVGSLNWYVE